MTLINWLSNLRTRFLRAASRRSISRKRTTRRSSPHSEVLEDRTLLSAYLDLNGTQTLAAGANINVSANAAGGEQEMVIDVNPTNPLNLAGFSHRNPNGTSDFQADLYYSTDGGATWTTSQIVDGVDGFTTAGAPRQLRFDPSIAFDADGRLYVAYGVDDVTTNTRRLIVGRSSDGGATFDQFSTVDTSTLGQDLDKWHLATGLDPSTGNQAVYIAYLDNFNSVLGHQQVKVSGSNNGGASWTTPVIINDETGADDARFPKPAVGPNGELYVVWHDLEDGQIKVDTNLDGLFTDGLFNNSDSFGTDVVAVNLNTDLFFSGSPTNPPTVPAQPDRGIFTNPIIDVDRSGGAFDGTLYISYGDVATAGDAAANANIYLVRSLNEGATWSGRTLVDAGTGAVPNNSTEFHAWVDVDQSSGSVNVVYYTSRGDEGTGNNDVNVRLATSTDGGVTFPATQQVNLTTATSDATGNSGADYLEYIGLVVHDGTAHGFWSDIRAANMGDHEAFTANASFGSTTGNVLTITGDDGGVAVDDDIIIRRSAANTNFLEVIQNGSIVFAGLLASVDSIVVNSLFGDDRLTVDYTNGDPIPAGGLSFDGGDPTASDEFLVVGTTGMDTIDVDLVDHNSANVSVNGGATIAVNNTELLLINGQQGDDDVTVNGPSGDGTNFIHTPGAGFDEGRVDSYFDAFPAVTLLPVEYLGLGDGSLTLDGSTTGLNSLTVLGTNQPDLMVVEDLLGNLVEIRHFIETQDRIDIFGANFFTVEVLSLDGDDRINWELGTNEDELSFLTVDGGNAGVNGDILRIHGADGIDDAISLFTSPIADYGYSISRDGNGRLVFAGAAFVGLELIEVEGDGGNDMDQLTVSGTGNDDQMKLLGGFSTDLIQGNFQTPVAALGNFGSPAFDTITVSLAGGGNDSLAVDVSGLNAAQNYVIEGASDNFDEIIILGTNDNDEVDVVLNGTMVEVTVDRDPGTMGNVNTIVFEAAQISRLTFDTLGGDDLVNINVAGTDLIGIPMVYHGGEGSDRLLVQGTPVAGVTVSNVTYLVGPDVGAGSISYDSNSADMSIEFTGLEPVIDLVPAVSAQVLGTNADNAINYRQGSIAANGLVSIDGFETYEFSNKTSLVINALAGSDTINFNNPNIPTGLATINVIGGEPTADTDTVIVNGTAGQDTVTFDSLSANFARVMGLAPNIINVSSTEQLIYNGQGGNDLLTVTGSGTFVHTPGATVDSGRMALNSFLGIDYINIGAAGTITANGTGGADTLVANGTASSDQFDVAATTGYVTLTDTAGPHVVLQQTDIENLALDGLDGDDSFNINTPQPYTTIDVLGQGPGGSDILTITDQVGMADNFVVNPGFSADEGTVQVNVIPISFNGIERILLLASGDAGDSLTVNDDLADNTWNLFAGPIFGDRIQVDDRATVDYAGFDTVALVNVFGRDVFNVQPTDLTGFATSLTVTGNGDDALVAIGTAAADALTATAGGGGQGTATVNSVDVQFDGLSALVFEGGEGDDTLTVDNSSGLVTVPVAFNGGSGSDELRLIGSTAIDNSTYTPGATIDAGTVVHTLGGTTQTISFTGLEPVVDLVAATTLTVNATNADNAITYSLSEINIDWGKVSVDGFESIHFANKTNLEINGQAGNDVVNLDALGVPVGLTGTVNVDGGSGDDDRLVVNGLFGGVTVNFAPIGSDIGSVSVAGLITLPDTNYTTTESVLYVGRGGGDLLTVTSPSGGAEITFTPGATQDSGFVTQHGFSDATELTPFEFRDLGTLGELTFMQADAGANSGLDIHGTDQDDRFSLDAAGDVVVTKLPFGPQVAPLIHTPGVAFLRLIGEEGDDIFDIAGDHPIPTGVSVQGGDPSASDVLNFTGSGAGAVTINLQDQTVTEAGSGPVFYSGTETVNVDAAGQNVSFDGRVADDDISVTPTGINSVLVTVAGIDTVFEITNIVEFDVDGMGGDNTLTVNGTTAGEIINVTATNVAVGALEDIDFANIDALTIAAGEGQDTINVTPSAIPVFVNGGNPIGQLQQPVGDILNVITGGAAFTFLPGPEPDSGTLSVTGSQPVSFDEIELLQINGVNYILPDRFDDPDLVFPGNDSIATATNLGSEPTVIEQRLTLHDTGAGINEDFFKITAHDTGKLIFNVFFDNTFGNIDIEVQDMDGQVVFASAGMLAQGLSMTDNEQIIIPVVAQEMYFLRVFSADGSPNIYNLEIENFAAPVPDRVHLDPADDLGMMANDNITSDPQPRFIIQADLFDFAAMGIDILTSAEALANLADPNSNPFPGAAVEVHIISSTTGLVHDAPVGGLNISGFANPIGVSNILFDFTPTNPLPDDTYFVAAAVRIFDGQNVPPAVGENGRTRLSEPLWFTIDTTAPKGMILEDFLAVADADGAGVRAGFELNPAGTELDVTVELAQADLGGQTPAFADDDVVRVSITDDTNAVVFDLLAAAIIDAESSRLGVQITDPAPLLADLRAGLLNIEVELSGGTVITADILPSGGPLRMLQSSDTGMSLIDDVTNLESPAFLVKAEANAKVRIFARNTLTGTINQVGNGVIGSDNTDGILDNGFGLAEITVEPIGDGSYEFFAEFEDLAGNISRHYDFAATGLPVPLPDLSTVDVPINVAGLFGTITDLDVTLDITHTFVADLTVQLISPSGTTVTLFSNIDGGDDNFIGTILDDEAATSIDTGAAPFTGRFRLEPPALLLAFDGEDPNGQWILRVMDVFGGDMGTIDDVHLCIRTNGGLPVEIDTLEPNTAQLDVIVGSDTGRHDEDNVTFDNTPSVTVTTEDPNSQFHTLFTDNLKFRIFDRYESTEEFLLYDSARDPAVDAIMTPGDMFTSLQVILETLPEQYFTLIGTNDAVIDLLGSGVLADGVHELKLEVEDRAGNISHDFLLTLIVDTVPPPVSFGLSTDSEDGLTPDSDSGKAVTPETLTDNITNVTNPTFWGRAEANSIVRIFLDLNEDGLVDAGDIFLGQDTAIPIDGNDAEPDGYWEITSIVGLNDPDVIAMLGLDGLRQILVTAEDLAGNVNVPGDEIGDEGQVLQIFIDTQGPVVFDPDGIGPRHAVEIGGAIGYNLLAPILGQGPTPPVFSLIVNIEDLPPRVAEFLYGALDLNIASETGHYLLVGDRQGIISIDDLIVTNLAPVAGEPARATIELRFDRPLADDRYTLTLFDEIVDPACNPLDGESRANSPTGDLLVRSGDGVPGGDFVARFTVDSRVEIASVGQGVVQVDINGNFIFDPSTGDFVNRDQTYRFGLPTDAFFAGQFTPQGVPSDGFDRIGAYGFVNGAFRWLLDFNNDAIADSSANSILQINGLPFAGEFVAGQTGDEVGLFDGTTWYIDTNGDNNIGPADLRLPGNMRGLPIVGDFDGDGLTDLATHLASTNTFYFDLTGAADGTPGVIDGNTDATIDFGFGGVLERPFAGDFNLDGVTDIGLTVPSQNDLGASVSDWYLLISNPAAHTPGTLNALFNAFFPIPGEDVFTQFGSRDAVPLVGNFRAPAPQFANIRPGAGVVGADAGGGPHVRVFDNETGEQRLSFFAYNSNFTGGVRVASGDVNGDSVADIITGPGGGGPHVKVFSGVDGSVLMSFFAFDGSFTGGVNVASGDVNMDGRADVIVSMGRSGSEVRVFSGLDGSLLTTLSPFPGFMGGVSVGSGDVNMDGFADVVVGAGPGGGPHVKVFSGMDGSMLMSFFAYSGSFQGGVFVAAGDINGDGFADVITGPGKGGGPHVKVFSGNGGAEILGFMAFSPGFTGGIRVAAGDVGLDGQVDILVTTGPGISPIVRAVTGTGVEIGFYSAFGSGFTGGAFVAGGPMPGETLLLAGEAAASSSSAATVSDAELAAIAAAAASRLDISGSLPAFRITDLPGQQLGQFLDGAILIDVNAAGQGWFIDATPDADEEFDANGRATNADALGRVDLLSVLLHELGHFLGLADLHGDGIEDLMAATINPVQRRLLENTALDNAFSDENLIDSLVANT